MIRHACSVTLHYTAAFCLVWRAKFCAGALLGVPTQHDTGGRHGFLGGTGFRTHRFGNSAGFSGFLLGTARRVPCIENGAPQCRKWALVVSSIDLFGVVACLLLFGLLHCRKCASEGIGRRGIVLKRKNRLQKELMPCRPVPLLVRHKHCELRRLPRRRDEARTALRITPPCGLCGCAVVSHNGRGDRLRRLETLALPGPSRRASAFAQPRSTPKLRGRPSCGGGPVRKARVSGTRLSASG